MELLRKDQDVKLLRELVSYYELLKSSQSPAAEAAKGAGEVAPNGTLTETQKQLRKPGVGTLLPELEDKLVARFAVLRDRQQKVLALEDGQFSCPKVRYGKTELNISVVTCGGMRQQLTWKKDFVTDMSQVPEEVQSNFTEIVRRAFQLGINHFETARGYGSSEIQFGEAFRQLIAEGVTARDQFLLQTKVPPKATAEEFRKELEKSFEYLGVEYVDLFSFHGLNREHHLKWIFDNGAESNWAVVQELKAQGKIRHIGFSTHALTPIIVKAIETDQFEYVNLHYQFFGSYTGTGSGSGQGTGTGFASAGGNLEAVRAAVARDMGVFVISPYDKGGMLYKPSTKVYNLCMPDMSPMELEALWSWHHPDPTVQMHTISVGAARPSDFDEPILAAARLGEADLDQKIQMVTARLKDAAEAAFDAEWLEGWHKNVPDVYESRTGVYMHQILWLWSLVKAFGMYDFAKARYGNCLSNSMNWDPSKSFEDNTAGWNFVPGCAFREDAVETLIDELTAKGHPEPTRIINILREADSWLNMEADAALSLEEKISRGWGAATDQPWVPFPERG